MFFYFKVNEEYNKFEGIFSEIVIDMMYIVCGICFGYGGIGYIKIDIVLNGK